MLVDADQNAIVMGERFDATLGDISDFLLEVKADFEEYEATPNAPAIICIDTDKGYVPGNIEIVSNRAVTLIEMLRDVRATPDEIRGVANWMDRTDASIGNPSRDTA
jgi:hypothetical protein